ncbi:MAG: trypsin-like peptidase domain-containing protein [Acutalibacteraceae bacterium]|nr:trypsin-like peptidase domain-containing protein [Acutalibacteraceae bacterium]
MNNNNSNNSNNIKDTYSNESVQNQQSQIHNNTFQLPQFNNQPQMSNYQPMPQQQFNNQPPIGNYQQNPMQYRQFNNQPQIMGNYQPMPQQQFNNQPPTGNYNHPPIQYQSFNNQPPMANYQPIPNQKFNNQMPMANYQTTPNQQFNNQMPLANCQTIPNQQFNNQMPIANCQTTPNQQFNNQTPLANCQTIPNQQSDNQPTEVNCQTNSTQKQIDEKVSENSDKESTVSVENAPNTNQNPYENNCKQEFTQSYNNNVPSNAPNIEYIPYIQGTPLPQGVTPQFINGGWYYPISINSKKQKKKMDTSVKVLIGIISGLIVLFITLLIIWTSTLTKENGVWSDGLFDFDSPFSDDFEKDEEPERGALANPNGPEILLESNNIKNGSTEKAYDVLSESVVSISVYDEDEQPSTSLPKSEGTGIILSEDGYIVTNSHVILDDIESNVWITTKSGDAYPVGIVGCDVRTDLAVLKCEDAKNWKSATFANSDELSVGQDVVAIGSPGGSSYSSSLTRGIISALNRPLSGSAVTYIQTDTPINPGNSGGPLANTNGQVIGINTIKLVDTQYEGMGFAIPSVTIKEVVDEIIKNGYVTGRARLGIAITEFSDSTAKYYGAKPGVKIESIDKDSPLNDTKAKVGDIITEIDGKSVETLYELYDVLDTYKPGDKVELTIYRFNEKNSSKNKEFSVEVELLGD